MKRKQKNKKKLLVITIYEDIDEQYEVTVVDDTYYTINDLQLYETIRQVITMRLDINHKKVMAQLTKKNGDIKTI